MMDRRRFLGASTAAVAAGVMGAELPVRAAEGVPAWTPPAVADDGLAYRQVHLDFHTSGLIPDVGVDFDGAVFARTLREARVNSINVFAKCSHGWAYYDTKVAHKHPHLQRNLLAEQLETLGAAGIAAHLYYSIAWDQRTAEAHPEWRARNKDGSPAHQGYWPWVCMNTPYMDQVIAENDEILSLFHPKGMWWDIVIQPPAGCYCTWCVAERRKLGMSDSAEDVYRQNKRVALRAERRLHELAKRKQPDIATFYNSRLVVGISDELKYYSTLQVESLPSGGWGYTHFEHRARYCHTLGKPMVGMTGKFHKSWGDFGGFKPQAALNFECMNFLANGAAAGVGDQLHPRGVLDPVTYRLIGGVYERVQRQEAWVRGMRPVADIGVVSTLAEHPSMDVQGLPAAEEGVTNMLVELHAQFDVLDLSADFARYKLLVLPDNVDATPELVEKMRAFVAGGGAVLLTYRSLLAAETGAFAVDAGVRVLGPSRFRQEYMVVRREGLPEVARDAYFLYQQGLAVAAEPGVEVWAVYGHPYFDRTPEHWMSHAQAPMAQVTEEPVITRKGKVMYCANPLFASYALDGELVTKEIVRGMIAALVPEPLVRAKNVPSMARLTLMQRPDNGDQMVQMLYAPYERRAPQIDVIEEPASFVGGVIDVQRAARPGRVRFLDGEGRVGTLPFRYAGGYVRVELPVVTGQMAVYIG